MYFPLFVVVFLAWLLFAGGTIAAWREHTLPGWLSFLAVGGWTGIAALVILFGGPYWRVAYQMLLQPG